MKIDRRVAVQTSQPVARSGPPYPYWELILPQLEVFNEGDGSGSLVIRMPDDANEYVIADAVLVQKEGDDVEDGLDLWPVLYGLD